MLPQVTWRKDRKGKWSPTDDAPLPGDYVEKTNPDGSTTRSDFLNRSNYDAFRPQGPNREIDSSSPTSVRSLGSDRRGNSSPGAEALKGQVIAQNLASRAMRNAARDIQNQQVDDVYAARSNSEPVAGARPADNMSRTDADAYMRHTDKAATATRVAQMQTDASARHQASQQANAERVRPAAQAAIAKRDAYESSKAPKSTTERMADISKTLKPGDFVSVRNGNTSTTATSSTVTQDTTSAPPKAATAKTMDGKEVPIAEANPEYQKIAAAQDRADKAATDTAAYSQWVQDQNPATKIQRAIQTQREANGLDPYGRTIAPTKPRRQSARA